MVIWWNTFLSPGGGDTAPDNESDVRAGVVYAKGGVAKEGSLQPVQSEISVTVGPADVTVEVD